MSDNTKRSISIFIESGAAEKAYDKLIAKEKELKAELEKATNPKLVEKINSELSKLSEPIDRAQKKLKGELSPTFRDVQKTANDLGNRLKKLSTEDADYTKILQQYKEANQELDKQKEKLAEIEGKKEGKKGGNGVISSFLGNLYATAVAKATSLITEFFGSVIEEAEQAEQHTARFRATLEGIGHSEVFDRMIAKANEVAARFSYLDNDDVVGVFEKLIDYGKLTEEQMNDLLPVIINFAAKQRISISEATDVMTKALEGNGKGLKTFGINLTNTHTPAERLKVIMGELKEKVDGAADAFQNTASGGLAKARQEYKNLAEDLGTIVLPALNKVLDFLVKAAKGLKGITQESEQLADEKTIGLQFHANTLVEKYQKLIDQKKFTLDQVTKELQKKIADGTANEAEKLALSKLLNPVLGNGDPNEDPEAQKKAEEARKKREEDLKKLHEDLARLSREFAATNQSDLDKEIEQTFEKFNALKDLAHGNREELKKIDEAFYKALTFIREKYAEKEIEAFIKAKDNFDRANEEFFQNALKSSTNFLSRFESVLTSGQNKSNAQKSAELQYQIAKSFGEKRFKLQQQKLDEERAAAIESATQAGESIQRVNTEFDLKDFELRKQHINDQLNLYIGFASQVAGILSTIDSSKTAKENAELARDQKLNDKKKSNLERRLKAGMITQLDYDRQLAEIDKKQEARQREIAIRQFKRKQKDDEVQALLNGATAVVKTLEEFGPPIPPNFAGIIAMALTVGTTIAQVAAIRGQKPPEFADGGLLNGPSHANGGIALLNTRGQAVAEAEGGEGIANKRTMSDRRRYYASGTPSQIISALNGLYGAEWESGASLYPVWSLNQPSRMNFGAINSSLSARRMFADGGITPGSGAGPSGSGPGSQEFLMVLGSMQQTIANMQATLDNIQKRGIQAYVPIRHFNDQQDRLSAIISDATLKP
jgi:hypothetical protein